MSSAVRSEFGWSLFQDSEETIHSGEINNTSYEKKLIFIAMEIKIEKPSTGGPQILWFLVPNGYPEMQGSGILGTVFSIKPPNGSKEFQKSPLLGHFFHKVLVLKDWNSIIYFYWIVYHKFWFILHMWILKRKKNHLKKIWKVFKKSRK